MTTGKKREKLEEEEEEEEKGKQTMSSTRSSSSSSTSSSSSDENEYEVQDLRDRLKSSRGSRFDLIENELTRRKFSRQALLAGFKHFVILPDNRRAKPLEMMKLMIEDPI